MNNQFWVLEQCRYNPHYAFARQQQRHEEFWLNFGLFVTEVNQFAKCVLWSVALWEVPFFCFSNSSYYTLFGFLVLAIYEYIFILTHFFTFHLIVHFVHFYNIRANGS